MKGGAAQTKKMLNYVAVETSTPRSKRDVVWLHRELLLYLWEALC